MKTKKLLLLLLCFVMLFGTLTLPAYADDASVTVYVTLSKYGEILTGKDGHALALAPVTLYEESTDLDTVFKEFHTLYHPDGQDAYASYEGEYGTAISKLWNDTSEFFGYQVNGGSESVYGLSHTVKDGDYVDVCIYKNKYPDTESYTKFDTYTKSEEVGEEVTLTLYEAGYDENWNTVFLPCADAEITINGESTDFSTDEDGKVLLSFEEEGNYIISASKEKTVKDTSVAAICAPVCIMNITPARIKPVHDNIAEKYSSDEMMSDGNALWFASDIADYGKIYGDTSYYLSEDSKQKIADYAIDLCNDSNKPGDLAKAIIALRSMGYDAKKAYTEEGELLNIPEKLLKIIETNFEEVSNVYTLPYVIIALGEGEDYAPVETMEALINYAVENNDKWLDMEFGTDALTPMLLALSPYTELNPEVQSAVENGTETLISSIDENGMTGNAPSTALSIVALCAMGINPKTTANGNLIDGLFSQLNDNEDGFLPNENTFATEQGMRALNAYMLFKKGERIFNFTDFSMDEIHHTITPKATIIFETDPESAEVTVNDTKAEDKTFVLEAGTYFYKVSKSGYKSEKDKFEISPEEAGNFETITIEVELSKKSSGGGGGGGGGSFYVKPEEKTEDIKTEQAPETPKKTFPDIADNPYKEAIENLAGKGIISGTDTGLFMPDSTVTRAEFTVMITKALSLESEIGSPFDDVKENEWFAPYVISAYKSGIVHGVSENSFNPYGTITKEEAAAMVCRAVSLLGVNTVVTEDDARNILCQFADYKDISPWANTSMAFCYQNNILNISELNVTPKKLLSRAEIASMLWNMIKEAEL